MTVEGGACRWLGLALIAGALCLCASQAAFAQTPQNPEACAQLRADLGKYIRDLMVIGQTEEREAMYAAETMLEIRRMTGDPCFGTLAPANRDACARLQSVAAGIAVARRVGGGTCQSS
jgi:hypothetical protein